MCTISWFYYRDGSVNDSEVGGYEVFFNRDEQRSRLKAHSPAIVDVNGVRGIMPVDPQGRGTWIAVNELGCTFALLNFYQGRLPKGKLYSRGKIIPALLSASSVGEIKYVLEDIQLNRYAPFSLLFFSSPNDSGVPTGSEMEAPRSNVSMFRWTGKGLEEKLTKSPVVSSAINYDAVLEQRLALYNASIPDPQPTRSDFYRLHRSHEPEKSAYSICMHRQDAKTVSLSHVCVNKQAVEFNYFDGSPCENREGLVVEMSIRSRIA